MLWTQWTVPPLSVEQDVAGSNPRQTVMTAAVFETAPFDHSGTSPYDRNYSIRRVGRWREKSEL